MDLTGDCVNTPLQLMRGFSIRLRMHGAIVMVLALFALVGVTGLLGGRHLSALNTDFMHHSIKEFRNVGEVRTRARLATLVIGEDRDGVLLQLKELNRLEAAEPGLQLVPGHDQPRIATLVAGGFLERGFLVAPNSER